MNDYQDPFDSASNPEQPTPEAWGQVKVDANFVAFADDGNGGRRLAMFDPQTHKIEDRRTNIAIDINPLAASGSKFVTTRRVLRESGEWARIVWPSLQALGINNLRELHDRWAYVQLVPSGRKPYPNKNTGEMVTPTTIKFVALFESEAACEAAYRQAHPNGAANAHVAQPTSATTNTPPTAPAAAANEKAVALRLVEALIRRVDGDEAQLAQRIAGMPVISRHLTAKSPEVMQMLNDYLFEKMGKAA